MLMPKPEDWSVASDIGGARGESAHRKGEGRALVSLEEHRISWEPPPPLFPGLCSDFPGSAFIASWSLLPLHIRLVLIPEVCMCHPVPFFCHCLREALQDGHDLKEWPTRLSVIRADVTRHCERKLPTPKGTLLTFVE